MDTPTAARPFAIPLLHIAHAPVLTGAILALALGRDVGTVVPHKHRLELRVPDLLAPAKRIRSSVRIAERIVERRRLVVAMALLDGEAVHAVPDVIRHGYIFDRQENWKGRGVNSFVLVAPIMIGNENYVCEAIVEQKGEEGKEKRFYLHEVNLQSQLSDTIKTPTGGAGNGKPARPVENILSKSRPTHNVASDRTFPRARGPSRSTPPTDFAVVKNPT